MKVRNILKDNELDSPLPIELPVSNIRFGIRPHVSRIQTPVPPSPKSL